jgi:hypothetical protein
MTAEWLRHGKMEKDKDCIEMECAEFVMQGLNLLAFIREYKTAKKYYSEHNAAHLHTEINTLKEHLTVSETEARQTKAALAAKTVLLSEKEKENDRLVRQQQVALEALTKENEQLKLQLAQYQVSVPQPAMLSLSPNPATVTAISLHQRTLNVSCDAKKLTAIKAVVIGGADSWQNKLKNHLPHFTFLPGDASNFDEALILNADTIFANIRCKFNHDCYYRLMRIVRMYQKPITFLSKTNIALTIHQMAQTVDSPPVFETNAVL